MFVEQTFDEPDDGGAAMGTRRSERHGQIERAMRMHPAGGRLRPADVAVGGADQDVTPGRTPLRLTARGRRLVAVLGLAAGVGASALVGSVVRADDSGGGLHLAGQSSVVVRSGDTLWSIASSVARGQDVRAVVDRIEELNGLPDSDLVPGQVLRLP